MTENMRHGMCVCDALLFAYWVIFHAFLSSADFLQNQLFQKILSGIPSECQTVLILTRPDIMSGLIWVQNCLQRLSADDASKLRDIFGILKIKDGSIKAVYFIFISRMVVFIPNINSGSAD